jgi:hypothetical protein
MADAKTPEQVGAEELAAATQEAGLTNDERVRSGPRTKGSKE